MERAAHAGVGSASRFPERLGSYRIVGVLGRGATGVVYDAESSEGRAVALKVVRAGGDAERVASAVARFEREARILGQLDHPSVVRLVDAGAVQGLLYIAMEKVVGVSLLAVRRQGPLELEPLIDLGRQLAAALVHIHGVGVVHRDIKPANVLVRTADRRPVLTDFGISGLAQATGITRQGDLLGSPGFMAPEVIDGQPHSPASDQYALGRLLFELGARGPAPKLSTGVPILEVLRRAMAVDWERFPKHERWPQLATVLERMLDPEPASRYSSLAAIDTVLTRILSGALSPQTLRAHVDRLDVSASASASAGPPPFDPSTVSPVSETLPHEPLPTPVHDTWAGRPSFAIEPWTRNQDEARIRALQDQVRELRGELRVARSAGRIQRVQLWTFLALAATIVAVMGLLVGRWTAPSNLPPVEVVVLPQAAPASGPRTELPAEEETARPTAENVEDAARLLRRAGRQLQDRDMEGAESTLELCTHLADLPGCHRLLGTLRAVAGDPRARSSFERYLELTPSGDRSVAVIERALAPAP